MPVWVFDLIETSAGEFRCFRETWRIAGGMVAAYEVLVANSPVRNLIKDGKSNQLRNQVITGQSVGMQTIELSLNELVHEGRISYDEAVARSGFPKEIDLPVLVH